jgi:hypothetical protein
VKFSYDYRNRLSGVTLHYGIGSAQGRKGVIS